MHLCKKALIETINIGKSLGDSFAWIFYENNQEKLYEHLNHQSTGLFVAGIGGHGEIEFIRQNQNLHGCFTIYHGITSMLRIGDFSLYAMPDGIIAIGELKTERQGNNLSINAYLSSKFNLSDEIFERNPDRGGPCQ